MIRLPELPNGLRWYAVNRQRKFPVYGVSGGLTALWTAIIIHHLAPGFGGDFGRPGHHDDADGKWFRFDFTADATQPWVNDRVENAVRLLIAH